MKKIINNADNFVEESISGLVKSYPEIYKYSSETNKVLMRSIKGNNKVGLVKKGYKVVAFDRYNLNNHYGWLENSKFKNKIEFILGDIRDYDSVNKAMKGCDTVMHLAALGGIPYSYISPTAYIKTNLEGTFKKPPPEIWPLCQ